MERSVQNVIINALLVIIMSLALFVLQIEVIQEFVSVLLELMTKEPKLLNVHHVNHNVLLVKKKLIIVSPVQVLKFILQSVRIHHQ